VADAERSLCFAELEERCARAAGLLEAAGVGRGDRVALLLANRTAYLELVFGAARLGAIAVPINTRLAPPELAFQLRDCEPRVLAHEASLSGLADAALAEVRPAGLRTLAVGAAGAGRDAYEDALAAARPQPAIAPVSPDDPMILMYTSGTTGQPKGALLPHRKTLANSLNAQLFFDLGSCDRVLVVVPLFHSFGLAILALPALYAGGSLVLARQFDADAVWRCVGEHGITFFGGVPTMFRELEAALAAAPPGRYDLSSLRFLFTAGAAIPATLIHAFQNRGIVLKQGFGQTETSILCCLDARDAVRKAGSVGKPVFHAELRIVTRDSVEGPSAGFRDTAPGEIGEIVARGPITMTGYWRRPEETARTLRDGWLRTGDLGRFDAEGFVALEGRARDLYISGGENVYPAEVEAVFERHPSIREIAVVSVPDERWGETGWAYVVLQPGAVLDPEALRAFGSERLARFKLPARFIAVAALPRTASGKVQKHRLADPGSEAPDRVVEIP
jgi:fatty-acyl-CoA synthase